MAREWSLQEIKALVEEHIALKEERPEVRTASEHWNEVSKKLREKGFNRSYKSCNKRWYRLVEQYGVQTLSFNMEEGKQRNDRDLFRAERLEFRDKWPQLRSGEGIEKEILDSPKKFTHQYEKDTSETTSHANGAHSVESAKEEIQVEPRVELNRQSAPSPTPLPAASVVALQLNATPLLQPKVTELKQQDNCPDSENKSKVTWPAPLCEQQVPLSSQETLDGFKFPARELRKRRTSEVRRNNRTVPYNSTHCTTFMKPHVNQAPSSQQVLNTPNPPPPPPPLSSEPTTFGSITVMPPPDPTTSESPVKMARASSTTRTKLPIIQFKRVNPNPSYKMDGTNHAPAHQPNNQQPIGSHLNFQTSSHNAKTNQDPWSLHSVNSHLPLVQPNDSHVSHQVARNGDKSDVYQVGSLEQRSGDKGIGSHEAAVGGVGVHLGAIAELLKAKHVAEQEF